MSIDRSLTSLRPEFSAKLLLLTFLVQQHGLPLRVFETYRTNERQAKLYERGVSKIKKNGGHTLGRAADFVGWDGRRWSWQVDNDVWEKFEALVDEVGGLKWGGRWSFYDPFHVELE